MKTEKEKMLAGELYNASDSQLIVERGRARLLCKNYNDSTDEQNLLRKDNAVAIEQMVLQNEGWERDVEVPEPTQT